MNLVAPGYYKDFKCIKGDCRHSCCIGWQIRVDPDTYDNYCLHSDGYYPSIKNSIISENGGDVLCFSLKSDKKCPHLTDGGLCRIIMECGEDEIPEICREHPRFYNLTECGLEVGIGLSCEAAARLILLSDAHLPEVISDLPDEPRPTYPIEKRNSLIRSSLSPSGIDEKLSSLASEYSLPESILSDSEIRDAVDSLEYLHGDSRDRICSFSPTRKASKNEERILSRALSYFVFRHVSGAADDSELRSGVLLAVFLTRLLELLILSGAEDEALAIDLARLVSEEIEYSPDNLDEIILFFMF